MYIASNGIKTAVILPDPDPISPRDPSFQENLGTMVCWHSRYRLGDKHSYETPDRFMEEMTSQYVSDHDFLKAIHDGNFELLRTQEDGDGYKIQARNIYSNSLDDWEADAYEPYSITKNFEFPDGIDVHTIRDDLMSYCSATELMRLCNKCNNVAILPLYLYDHSGLSISSGSFIGRAPHAEWDSGQVGFSYLDKDTAMRELAIPGDTMRIAMVFDADHQTISKIQRKNLSESIDSVLENAGYSPVAVKDISNLFDSSLLNVHTSKQPVIDPDALEKGLIFKKGHKLYEYDGWNPDGSFNIKSIAVFNLNMKRLTDENWTNRAVEYLNSEIQEYDNYLTGEIYGYQLYEGLDEVDSCWEFNPGKYNITDVMKEELGDWLTPDMEFEPSYNSKFDIEAFFEENEFPEYKKLVTQRVVTQIYEDFQSHIPFPYATSFEDLRSNKDNILNSIVESIYDTHEDPTTELIRDTIFEYAGIARELQPKITVSDLDPNRDYTASEIMSILQQKPSLEDMIAGAAAKLTTQISSETIHNPKKENSIDL